MPTTVHLVKRLVARIDEVMFREWLGADVVLVPIPRHAPLRRGALWVPHRLADAMVDHGLGAEVRVLLRRINVVPKAAFSRSAAEGRLHRTHYESLLVEGMLTAPREVLLIDDVVATGATFYGAATLLQEAYPDALIRCFAAVQSVAIERFHDLFAPGTSQIRPKRNGTTWRRLMK